MVFESEVCFNNNKNAPKRHIPRGLQNQSLGNTRGSENLLNRKKGVTGLTSQWVSGRTHGGQPSIGPLWAGVAGWARPGHRLQLCPDPRTHRNCMAATLPTPPSVSAPLSPRGSLGGQKAWEES